MIDRIWWALDKFVTLLTRVVYILVSRFKRVTRHRHSYIVGETIQAPLEGRGHTEFMLLPCKWGCGTYTAFPYSNYKLALEEGTSNTKQFLLGLKVVDY